MDFQRIPTQRHLQPDQVGARSPTGPTVTFPAAGLNVTYNQSEPQTIYYTPIPVLALPEAILPCFPWTLLCRRRYAEVGDRKAADSKTKRKS